MKNNTYTKFAGAFLACVSIFAFVFVFSPKTTFAFDGSGTAEDPYLITDCNDLQAIPNGVPEGEYYKLSGTDPVDCTGTAEWNSGDGFDPIDDFSGDFDGNGMTIDGLTIDRAGSSNIGLFGTVDEDASIHDVTLTNVDITGSNNTAALVGSFGGGNLLIDNISVSGTIASSSWSIGGLVGYGNGYGAETTTISNSDVSADIVAGSGDSGGLIGGWDSYDNSSFLVDNDTFSGDIDVSETDGGGLLGYLDVYDNASATITNSLVDGSTISSDSGYSGGIIGYADIEDANATLTITNTSTDVTLDTENNYVGGFIGYLYVDRGEVTINGGSEASVSIPNAAYAGGVIGYIESYDAAETTIDSVSTDGTITSDSNDLAGMVAYFYAEDSSLTISNSQSDVTISAGNANVGGLVGAYEIYYDSTFTIDSSEAGGEGAEISGNNDMGGLIGYGYSEHGASLLITDSFAEFDQTNTEGGDYWDWGGLIGDIDAEYSSDLTITDSHSYFTASGNVYDIGGVIGYLDLYENSTLTIDDTYTSGTFELNYGDVGGMIGYAEADNGSVTIQNGSYSDLDIIAGSGDIGGMIGEVYEGDPSFDITISDSFAEGDISGMLGNDVGGLIGYVSSDDDNGGLITIDNSYVSNDISSDGISYVGGFLGEVYGYAVTIENGSHMDGNIYVGGDYIGGMIGYVDLEDGDDLLISDSYAGGEGTEIDGDYEVGGLVGESDLYDDSSSVTISGSSASYSSISLDSGAFQGGLIGYAYSDTGDAYTIIGSHAVFNLADDADDLFDVYDAGGFVGEADLEDTDDSMTITNSYASGTVHTSNTNIGGLIGYAYTSGENTSFTISGSHTDFDIPEADYYNGGLVGELYADVYPTPLSITNSYAEGDIGGVGENTNIGDGYNGGLVGTIDGGGTVELTIDGSYATGDIIGSGEFMGGLVGWVEDSSSATIEHSYATGDVLDDEETKDAIGGLVGDADGDVTISTSYATGDTKGYEYVGGLVGDSDGELNIDNSYATGNAEGDNSIGGLVGWMDGASVDHSYATGDVNALNDTFAEAGGLIGYTGDNSASFTDNFAAGTVTDTTNSSADYLAGLIGDYTFGATLTDNFYDRDRSGQTACSYAAGEGPIENTTLGECEQVNGEGAEPNYFFNNSSNDPFDAGAWDFTTIWKTNVGDYPTFIGSYIITASAGEHGSISPEGNTSFADGDDQEYTFTPDDGYIVSDVLVDDEVVPLIVPDAYTFTDISQSHTIHVTFTESDHTITASAGTGGDISPSGTVSVSDGGDQSFTITADGGYEISEVTVDGDSVGAVEEYTFEDVTENHTIHASFISTEDADHTIFAAAGAHGTISPSGNVGVNNGEDQEFEFDADSGYEIDAVSVDDESVGHPTHYTFDNVTDDHTIVVTFKRRPSGGGGGGGGHVTTTTTVTTTPTTTAPALSIPGCPVGFTCTPNPFFVPNPAAPSSPTTSPSFTTSTFWRTLKQGMTGEDVRSLQKFLNTHGFIVSSSGPGASGSETSLFGPKTKAAVVAFQNAHPPLVPDGVVGPKTIAAIMAIINGL